MRRLPLRSPPRMRGKAGFLRASSFLTGITPAYAGKRASRPTGRSGAWDHPRVCGEKIGQSNRAARHLGSPPRMRGKAPARIAEMMLSRITPAYAGKSRCNLPSTAPWKDHPRVCGEKALSTFSSRKNSGSPPRMRGKVIAEAGHHQIGGITPACAGKSAELELKKAQR